MGDDQNDELKDLAEKAQLMLEKQKLADLIKEKITLRILKIYSSS